MIFKKKKEESSNSAALMHEKPMTKSVQLSNKFVGQPRNR